MNQTFTERIILSQAIHMTLNMTNESILDLHWKTKVYCISVFFKRFTHTQYVMACAYETDKQRVQQENSSSTFFDCYYDFILAH